MKNDTNAKTTADQPPLYICEPVDWLWVPKRARHVLALLTMVLYGALFTVVPATFVAFSGTIGFVYLYGLSPLLITLWTFWAGLLTFSYFWPEREWETARKFGQLWYEAFSFSCNLSPECRRKKIEGNVLHGKQAIIGMHPHGIIPFNAILWAAYCDQYLSGEIDGKLHKMYGFGATTDIVMHLPLLRNLMAWLTAGGASYKILRAGLVDGKSTPANNVGRKPKNLYLLPGGIAEIACCSPGREAIVFKGRKGLCRLAKETGAVLVPTYVFGLSDCFHTLSEKRQDGGDTTSTTTSYWQLITQIVDLIFRFFRKLRVGTAVFWGPLGLLCPLFPYTPRITMVIGDPIEITESVEVDELHEKYIAGMQDLFEKYKAVAGYPNAKLEVL